MRSAPRFQLVTMPSGVLALRASSDESTMNARSAVLACSDCIVVSFVPFTDFSDFLRSFVSSDLAGCIDPSKDRSANIAQVRPANHEISDLWVSAGNSDDVGPPFSGSNQGFLAPVPT